MDIDKERMAHNIAMTFAKLQSEETDYTDRQSKFRYMLENYCAAYGYVMSQSHNRIDELISYGSALLFK